MTSGEFSRVDSDLLADYVGGALQGTPDDATVARLVATDPDWQAAHEQLTVALAQLGLGLRALASTAEPMPQDVVARLNAALATESGRQPEQRDPATQSGQSVDAAAPAGVGARPAGEEHPSERHLSAVPTVSVDDDGVAGGPSRRRTGAAVNRRRWRPGVIAAAATVVAVAALGVNELRRADVGAENTATSAAAGQAAPPAAGRASGGVPLSGDVGAANAWTSGVSGDRVVASGTDYSRTTMAAKAATPPQSRGEIEPGQPAPIRTLDGRAVAAPLRRLNAPAALRACLDAISAAHQRLITTVDLVDYAAFDGTPALVVMFTDADGVRWAWVSGPACGDGAAGPATVFVARVG